MSPLRLPPPHRLPEHFALLRHAAARHRPVPPGPSRPLDDDPRAADDDQYFGIARTNAAPADTLVQALRMASAVVP
ncbi:hypothetical protein OV450_8349, partial [Actinobacteria bacterium OV450]